MPKFGDYSALASGGVSNYSLVTLLLKDAQSTPATKYMDLANLKSLCLAYQSGDPARTFAGLSLTGGTVTTSTPLVNASQTWNSAGTTFIGSLWDITNTASAAGSLVADWRIGGVSKFSVSKDGVLRINSAFSLPNADGAANKVMVTNGSGTVSWSTGTFTGSSSGTNTGDQVISISGDATGGGSGSFALTIANDAVTYAKMQNVSASRILGRGSSGSGDPEELTIGTGLSLSGTTLSSTVTGLADGDKGDITVSASGATWTIDNSAVSYAKIQNVSATDKLLGRSTAGAGVIEEIACTAFGRSILDDVDAPAVRTTLGLGTLATQSGTFSGTSSGVNTGDQTVSLTGDVTGSGSGSFAATIAANAVTTTKINNSAVTYAKIQNVSATDKLLGRSTAGSGTVEEITCTAYGRSLLDDADAATARTTLGLGTLATQNGTFSGTSSGTNSGDQTISLSGDVTGSGSGSFTATISADAVTYAKMQNVSAASRLLGRGSALGAGDPEELTVGTGLQLSGTVLSSTLTGLSDGDKGDITVSGSGAAWTIDNSAVTYAKIQNVSATDKLLGRSSALAGVIEEINCTAFGRSILDDVDAAAARTTLGLGTLATQSGTFSGTSSGVNTGDQTIVLSGDVSGSGSGSFTTTLSSVGTAGTYTKVTTDAKGRVSSGTTLAASDIPTLTASKISDFDTQVRTSRLDQMAAPTASVSLNSQKITSLATPTTDTDAATKAYVDAIKQGLDVKDSVRVATTASITLSGTQTIDGVAVVAGDRVLVKDQGTPSANGIYVVAAGAWSRATDADSSAKVTTGMFTFVAEGTANADAGFILTTNDTITLGTTSLTFTQFSGAGQITAGAGLTKTANTIDAVGTSNRITVNADSIDIASTYVGQTSITTLGTIGTGIWNGTTIAVANGGTGVTTSTGSGSVVLSTSPTLTTPLLGTPTSGTLTNCTGYTFANLASKPTTLNGFGITDAQPLDADLTAIAGLAGTSGLLKKTAADTWSLDPSTYLTGNQSITISGDATGSGSTAITLTLANSGVTAGTYNNSATAVTPLTVDAKGRITATGVAVTVTPAWSSITSKPTTLSGFGITDALSNSTTSTQSGYFGDIFLFDDSTPSHYLAITNSANLTLARTLSLNVNDADRTISLSGNLTVPSAATVSNTNTGDQTISLTGDVTGSGSGSFLATISNGVVSYAKIQNVSATDKLLGRSTAGSGSIEEITCTAFGRSILDDIDAATARTTLGLGTLATQSGTFSGTSSGVNTGDQTVSLTGDVTGSGSGSFAATIAANAVTTTKINNAAVTYAKIQNTAAASRILGRGSAAGAGSLEELSVGTGLQISGTTLSSTVTGLTDGSKGDITVSGSGATWSINNGAVTYADIQNVNTDRLLGRATALAGVVEEITCTSFGRSLIDDGDAATARTTLGLGTLATQSGTFSGTSSGVNSGDQTITLTGNVTGSGSGSFATTIASGVVSNAMLASVATQTFKGRTSVSTGAVEDLTATQATAMLDQFTSALKGLAPASGGGTSNYLRADGTWATPPNTTTSPGGSTTQVQYNSSGAFAGSANLTFNGTTLTAAEVSSPSHKANANTGYFLWDNSTYLSSQGTGIVDVNGIGAAGSLRVYNVYTTTTNYERCTIDWQASANVCRFGTEKGSGGGTARALSFVTDAVERMSIGSGGGVTINTSTSSFTLPTGRGSSGQVLQTDGAGGTSWATATGGSGTPGGSNSQLQYNSSGTFAGASGLTTTGTDLTITGSSLVSSSPVLSMTQTWNANAVTFTAVDLNITELGASASSILLNCRVGGSSKFSVNKYGTITSASSVFLAGGGGLAWTSRSSIYSSADGFLEFTANNGTTGAVVSSGGYRVTSDALVSATVTTGNFNLLASHNGKTLVFSNSTAYTITVSSGQSYPVGFSCTIITAGSGAATFTASGVTINSYGNYLTTAGAHSVATIICTASNVFNLAGNLV